MGKCQYFVQEWSACRHPGLPNSFKEANFDYYTYENVHFRQWLYEIVELE